MRAVVLLASRRSVGIVGKVCIHGSYEEVTALLGIGTFDCWFCSFADDNPKVGPSWRKFWCKKCGRSITGIVTQEKQGISSTLAVVCAIANHESVSLFALRPISSSLSLQ